ncbi:MAG TPA: ABC transporter ATP-binding protein/permease [Burkholderiales bacterium]|nr:ABC transporter ATP-binding protein/permease [Burkholderiales bacterium]
MATTRIFLRDLWTLTRPYWFSEERWQARGLLAVVVALNLGIVWVNVEINKWQNLFYNALQDKDIAAFYQLLLQFSLLAAAFIVCAVYQLYLNQMLQIRWRRWLTDHYLEAWVADRAYYRMQLTDRGTDNPDQRIAEDLALFVDKTLNLTLGLLSAVVTLVSFVAILWTLSGTLEFTLGGTPVSIEGYMVWVALIYAILGTWLAHLIGRPLISLNFDQQKFEANFRFSLVRFRENTESIAIYGGEADETRKLRRRFLDVVNNWWEIMRRQKKLTWFRSGYGQVAIIFPYVVAAPRFFSGAIPLGGLMQTASAFSQVQEALSWFVSAYVQLAEWKATVDRLTSFRSAAASAQTMAREGAGVATMSGGTGLLAQGLKLDLPDARPLLAPFDAAVRPGETVLVTGPSGSGKSTLFRAFAGIWPFGSGRVTRPSARMLFLPQKPYLTIGTLREQLSYPAAPETFDDEAYRVALADCGLPQLAPRLDEEQHWSQILSPGEQQRIAFARAFLNRPEWLFLDEATASLDEASEARLYRLLREKLPGAAVVSIGHRPSLAGFHERRWRIERDGEGAGTMVLA